MHLTVISHIKTHGLDETVSKFHLIMKDYGHKFLLKYNMFESDFSLPEVQDCRGLILNKETLFPMSLSFRKFFNQGDPLASKINWETATVLEKLDGTMIQLYWDHVIQKWCVGTTGTAEGEGYVNDPMSNIDFAFLFNTVFLNRWNSLNIIYSYTFELMSHLNVVVTPHKHTKITLLSVKDMYHFKELPRERLPAIAKHIGVPLVKEVPMSQPNFGTIIKTFEDMTFAEEGYVVVDANFNRVKVKNPLYVAAHYLKERTASHRIMAIITSKEASEYVSTFPGRRVEVLTLVVKYENLVSNLIAANKTLDPMRPKNITKQERKKFAEAVFIVVKQFKLQQFTSFFFGMQDGKIVDVYSYLKDCKEKTLYEYLKSS